MGVSGEGFDRHKPILSPSGRRPKGKPLPIGDWTVETCQVCGQVAERESASPCNKRCERIRKEASGEALQLFTPVDTIPGQIALGAEGEHDE